MRISYELTWSKGGRLRKATCINGAELDSYISELIIRYKAQPEDITIKVMHAIIQSS